MLEIILILVVVCELIYFLYCEFTPNKRTYKISKKNPYMYVTRNGGFGTDFEKMIEKNPKYFDEHYLEPMRKWRKRYEARGHVFHSDGRIEPPIKVND